MRQSAVRSLITASQTFRRPMSGAPLYYRTWPVSTLASPSAVIPSWARFQCKRLLSTAESVSRHEFKAETARLLDIVARSLYSDKEIFLRELISNANDSLEKLRILQTSQGNAVAENLSIQIIPDRIDSTITVVDNGQGMTKDELVRNLGTIAHSGSEEFTKEIGSASDADISKIIGRFGVGFYSTFMVADKIRVISRSRRTPDETWEWRCYGSTSYELVESDQMPFGTRVILHLKRDCTNLAEPDVIKGIIKKYSNFVGYPIIMNEKTLNEQKALWLEDPKSISETDYRDFFRFISKSNDTPRYTLHYKTDAPLSIRALLFVAASNSPMADLLRDNSAHGNLALYNRKVLITPRADSLLPRWLHFVKGVVDCEDIPLNLSREMLQDNQLISRLRIILTNRILRFLGDERKRDEREYKEFYTDYGLVLKEAIVRSGDQREKEDIAQLLLFESSALDEGKMTTLPEYVKRMKSGQNNIYYIAAPSRSLALSSPYYETFRQRQEECLFLCETHDELVVLQLGEYAGKRLRSIEQEADSAKNQDDKIIIGDNTSLSNEEANALKQWLLTKFSHLIKTARINTKLGKHPVAITASQMGSVRQFLRSPMAKQHHLDLGSVMRLNLEFNPRHELIKALYSMKSSDEALAEQLGEQIINNALVIAGLSEDPISVASKMNDLLCKLVSK